MKLLITSGGTTEPIDAVRGITNHSTGQLGKLMAEEFLKHQHEVTLVTTKSAVKPAATDRLTIIEIITVKDLMGILQEQVPHHEFLIHSMAVSDYTPVYMTDLEEVAQAENLDKFLTSHNGEQKISSQSDYQVLFLKKTSKVISYIKEWNPQIKLIGFKLLVNVSKEELIKVARASLHQNKADYILANDLSQINESNHQALLVSAKDSIPLKTKEEIAKTIYEKVTEND
ncbi:phosphopantothenate--cysteine ligase [Streptococcus didelphis]|uniref:phosphopantothenate--cysteine ligase n=1 Tax=Streptococcus didelphis TaxID=102886 RepID=UPI0024818AFF|nr:phosphopantothenate--cysteine ligase [Streptococcus didelphis]